MKKILLCFVLVFCVVEGNAQQAVISESDSVIRIKEDSTVVDKSAQLLLQQDTISRKQEINPAVVAFKPDPKKAIIYSVIFPGLGQIYNRKYWKLPIIYGGFLGLTYAVTWNGGYYNDYSAAYKAVMSSNPMSPDNVSKWKDFLPYGDSPDNYDGDQIKSKFSSPFKRKKDFYRRNRDLSIIGMVALYGLCIIDAYVDAQLFEFDISPDISMKIEPAVMMNNSGSKLLANQNALGVQCSFKF